MTTGKKILAGDIGGTKTVLAIVSEDNPRQPLTQKTFPSTKYDSLDAIVREFLGGQKPDVQRATIDVAGPVVDNRAQVTNLPWLVDGASISRELGGAPVRLINDLQAVAESVPLLEPGDLATVNKGKTQERGAIAVIAPGTGLGEGFLVWSGGRYAAYPSEGGHADFAPMTPEQADLWSYLHKRFGHVSCERVCSGSGIPNLYAFLRDSGRASEPSWLRDQLAQADDQTPVIVQAGLDNKAEICGMVVDLFVSILGGEAGNLGLKVLATGGVYIGGGIPPRIVSRLNSENFMKAFIGKGRLGSVLQTSPVHVILNPGAALIGSARHALAAG